MNNVVESSSAAAIAVIQQMKEHAVSQGHTIIIGRDSIRIYAGTFNSPEFDWRRLAKMAMIGNILQKPFAVTIDKSDMPIPHIDTGEHLNRVDVFLSLNNQLFNFLSDQDNIANHCVMFRVADNDINAQIPAFAELLNMYTNGSYHGMKYERDSIMYMYHAGQIEFELREFNDTQRVALASKYDEQYANDLNAIIANIQQEFPKEK